MFEEDTRRRACTVSALRRRPTPAADRTRVEPDLNYLAIGAESRADEDTATADLTETSLNLLVETPDHPEDLDGRPDWPTFRAE